MKKTCLVMVLLIFSLFLGACGGRKDAWIPWRGIQAGMEDLSSVTERVEYYDINATSEPIFQWGKETEGSPVAYKSNSLVGMQFYRGEPVQFWAVLAVRGELAVRDIWLYRQDGSRELLIKDISTSSPCQAYMDSKGNLYLWQKSGLSIDPEGGTATTDPSMRKYDPSGELLFEQKYEYGYDIEEMRQTEDGSLYLIVREREADSRRLAKLDPATGLITEPEMEQLADNELSSLGLGICGNNPAVCRFQASGNEIVEINAKKGTETCFLSFQGTTYMTPEGFGLHGFRILEDGSVELLWASSNGSESLRETLRMEKVERTPLILRGVNVGKWLLAQINAFNQSSGEYHIIVEDCGEGNDREDFARLTSVQMASGKGPDILYGSLMEEYISGLAEKGLLENLQPYMEESGIREEDYFPYVFSAWRDGDRIYSVSPASPNLSSYCMDSTVLGGMQEPGVSELVDALLAWPGRQDGQGDAVFMQGYDSQKLLRFLLKGTDTLWGMVDWEKGSCDFGGELFARILETAKRYGDSKDRGESGYIAGYRLLINIYTFDDKAEREGKGRVICGPLFDDGCHAAVTSDCVMAVNANSSRKEGAWEFLSFLLGDEAQSVGSMPASRKAYEAWVEKEKEQFANGRVSDVTYANRLADGRLEVTDHVIYTEADVTDEIVEEYTRMLEDARPYPLRTVPILDIIGEEAAAYFNGSKTAAEVAGLVANRVQTYLDEGR